MKKIIYSFIILTAFVWMVACDNVNSLHDKYLANGEDFLVGKLDSFKYYGGDQRAKLVVWASDFRATKLVISRADTTLNYNCKLNPLNRKDSMVFFLNSLKEGTNVLTMKTWNADSTVHSIPMGFTVTTWGAKYKSFLKSRAIVKTAFSLLTKTFNITWNSSNVIEPVFGKYAIGHQVKYKTVAGNDTILTDIYSNQVSPTVLTPLAKYPASGGSFSYRMLYLPSPASIDTFRTAYTTITAP